jgi:hypothetical protein
MLTETQFCLPSNPLFTTSLKDIFFAVYKCTWLKIFFPILMQHLKVHKSGGCHRDINYRCYKHYDKSTFVDDLEKSD